MAVTGIHTPRVEDYLARRLPSPHPVLREMESYARRFDFPIVGPQVGRFLELAARAVRARLVVELGSGFGYSAAWFLRGMGPRGAIHLTDASENHAEMARDCLGRMGFGRRFKFHVGDALDLLDALPVERADILFMDIDKEGYPDARRNFAPRMKPGALLLVDNLLWSGLVATGDRSPETRAIRAFTGQMLRDPRFRMTLLPVRDGVGFAVKVRM
ncbi:MAG: O-methyltransferase [Halobacteria archaeon]